MAAKAGGENVIACHTLEAWNEQLEKGNESKKLIVVDFAASWCGPCHLIAPFFEELAREYPDVTFLKVDYDELKSVFEDWVVQAMPTFLFLKEGKIMSKVVGGQKTKLQQAVAIVETKNIKNMIKTPAAGPKTGVVWEDKGYTGISQIFISYKPTKISSVQFQYVDGSGNLVLSPLHGNDDGSSFSIIHIDCQQNEFLIELVGDYGSSSSGFHFDQGVHSLTFETNKKKYGPFGGRKHNSDVSFEIQMGDDGLNQTFGGFHGTSSSDCGLISIGLYVKPRLKLSSMGSSDDQEDQEVVKSSSNLTTAILLQ